MIMSYSKFTTYNQKCQDTLREFKKISKVHPQVGKGWSSVRMEVHILEALTYVHWISAETLPFILVVLRKTWGYQGKKSWSFSYENKKDCRGIKGLLPPDVSERTVERAVNEAIARNIIVAVKKSGIITTYGFNKHYDTWVYGDKLQDNYKYEAVGDNGDTDDTGDIDGTSDTDDTGDINNAGDKEVGSDTEVSTYDGLQPVDEGDKMLLEMGRDTLVECEDGKKYSMDDYKFNQFHLQAFEHCDGFTTVIEEINWAMAKGISPHKAFGAILNKYNSTTKMEGK